MNKYKNFEDLGTSTKTVMVYCNMQFDIRTLFEKLPITEVDVPLTKKKKLPDIKKVKAPYNSIISLRHGNEFRGIVTKPDAIGKKAEYFLNQVTCILSLGSKCINIMIFKDTFKTAGSKETDQAIDAVKLLWGHINKIKGGHKMLEQQDPQFLFDVVMTNVDFKLGFNIDRKKLNNLMNSREFKDIVFMSRFETTANTNVNIKMFCKKQNNSYQCLVIPKGGKPYFQYLNENKYQKKDKKKEKYTTFLVFRSSKVIESGRFYESMRQGYESFIEIIKKNRDFVEEQIKDTDDIYIHDTQAKQSKMIPVSKFLAAYYIHNRLPKRKSIKKLIQSCPDICPSCESSTWWKQCMIQDKILKCNCNNSILNVEDFVENGVILV